MLVLSPSHRKALVFTRLSAAPQSIAKSRFFDNCLITLTLQIFHAKDIGTNYNHVSKNRNDFQQLPERSRKSRAFGANHRAALFKDANFFLMEPYLIFGRPRFYDSDGKLLIREQFSCLEKETGGANMT